MPSKPIEATQDSQPQQPAEKKKRFVFKEEHDELLLLEVLGDNGLFVPGLKRAEAWSRIETNLRALGVDATSHGMQCRLRLMYENHMKEERESKAASGVAEQLTEKKRLLHEYHDAMIDKTEAKEAKKARSTMIEEVNEMGGKAIRAAAVSGMDMDLTDEKPKKFPSMLFFKL
ncbi:hypothetical protein AC1031_003858 [Aphanomyces cochlioides]|nr:hypothetical protein AC1031_003858 [Aphanomyces cochlioides]